MGAVVPVMDLLGGQVVHGVAGERAAYLPIRSVLTGSAEPRAVATCFRHVLGCSSLYVADLEAIGGAAVGWQSLDQIASTGVRILLDAGVGTVARAAEILDWPAAGTALDGVIVGLESVQHIAELPALASRLGPERAVFSLDLKAGRPICACPPWQHLGAARIARLAFEAGFRRLIVLDVAAVGTGVGPVTAPLCTAVRSESLWAELISGGAVRSMADVTALCRAGCDRVLVASALHRGTIRPADLR